MHNMCSRNKFISLKKIAIDDAEEIVAINDLEFRYVFVNKHFLKLLRISDSSFILNKKIFDIFSKSISRKMVNGFNKVLISKEPASFILNLNNEDGPKIMKMTIFPIQNKGSLNLFLSVFRDITQEENLKSKFVEKISIINTLLDNMPILIYMKDKNNNYIAGTKYAKKFFLEGYDAYSDNVRIDIDLARELIEFDEEYVILNKKKLIKKQSFKSSDGTLHYYKVHKAPIFDVNEDVSGIITIAQNIDKEKQLEFQKELFIATLTHDLKTPLQAQISSLELLSKGTFGNVTDSQKEIIEMIIESTNFMKEMLFSILSTYKYENGLVNLHKSFFDIQNLIKICVKEASHLALVKNVEIEFKKNCENSFIFADESQIRRVLTNLLNNAINYAFKNSKIKIVLCENEQNLFVKIKNQSAPIPEEMRKHIFDKYISCDGLYKKRGIGLGLYFCKKVLDAHNGKIKLISLNTENEFVFELPKTKEDKSNTTLNFV